MFKNEPLIAPFNISKERRGKKSEITMKVYSTFLFIYIFCYPPLMVYRKSNNILYYEGFKNTESFLDTFIWRGLYNVISVYNRIFSRQYRVYEACFQKNISLWQFEVQS